MTAKHWNAEFDKIQHCLNAYPRLVEKGRALVEAVRKSGGSATPTAIAFDDLLRELGEDA